MIAWLPRSMISIRGPSGRFVDLAGRMDKPGSAGQDRLVPESGFAAAVSAVDWNGLRSTYGTGEVVREILLGLASRDEAEVRRAWEQINRTVLQHQGTVYPATVAAAPFLCQIALNETTRWRAALTADLAFLATGYDEPYSPAGTARAVRDGIRPYTGRLLAQWGTADAGLDMGLVAMSAAFPAEAAAEVPTITAHLADWFARSEPPLRTGLGLALGYHGLADKTIERIITDEVGRSIRWVARTGDLIISLPGQHESSQPHGEPYISGVVPDAIDLARHLRAGADEEAADLSPVGSFLGKLMQYGGRLIEYPR